MNILLEIYDLNLTSEKRTAEFRESILKIERQKSDFLCDIRNTLRIVIFSVSFVVTLSILLFHHNFLW